nr:MAG: capsid protein [Cressdnaviricota sp.]
MFFVPLLSLPYRTLLPNSLRGASRVFTLSKILSSVLRSRIVAGIDSPMSGFSGAYFGNNVFNRNGPWGSQSGYGRVPIYARNRFGPGRKSSSSKPFNRNRKRKFIKRASSTKLRSSRGSVKRVRRTAKHTSRRSLSRVPSRAALLDRIAPKIVYSTAVGDRFDVPATTTNQPGSGYYIPSCRSVGANALPPTPVPAQGGSYPIPHLLEMQYYFDSAAGNLSSAFVVSGYRHKHTLVNMSSSSTEVTVYKCLVRDVIPVNATFSTPLDMLVAGMVESGSAAAVGMTSPAQLAGGSPYDFPTFCQNYKILSQVHHVFAPGEEKIMWLTSKKRRMFRLGRWATPSDQTTTWRSAGILSICCIKNHTFLMFKVKGHLADTTVGAGNLTFTNPGINCFTEYHYDMKSITPNSQSIWNGGILGITASGGTAHSIEELTGADTTDFKE